jgi:cytochrome c peroxidase
LLVVGAAVVACSSSFDANPPPPGGDTNAIAARTLSPLPALPSDPSNAVADDPRAAAFGQMLFFDKRFSGPIVVSDTVENGGLGAVLDTGKVACASCHIGVVLDDRRSKPGNVSLGTDYGTRRALPLVNASFYKWTNWAGRFDTQWSLPLAVAESATLMNGTRLQIVHAIYATYKTEYEAIFGALDPRLDPASPRAADFPSSGKPKKKATATEPSAPDGPWEKMAGADRIIVNGIYVNYGKAIAAYLRLLVSRDTPFDKCAAGDKTAISASAYRGFDVFAHKGRCMSCHNGPHFSDGQFHALSVPQTGPHVPPDDRELGRYTDVALLLTSEFRTDGGVATGLVQDASQKGQFRTKSLRGVAASGPYMHAGQFATLEDVVAFYNKGGGEPAPGVVKDANLQALGLTPAESADLVEFLKTLSAGPVPAALTVDTSKP